ncbi:MAG: hypothetical protein WAK24_09725, partial [Candidatus Acidiferrales bacterium]
DRLQIEEPTVSYFDKLDIANDIDWGIEHVATRISLILVPAYPQFMRQAFNRQKKRIARMADEDLRNDIEATKAAVRLMQTELDRRTLAAKQKRLDDSARDIRRTALRIEKSTLKRLRGGKGFRQKP